MTSGCAELVVDCRNTLGEMPLWCARSGRLFWIDVFKPGRVFFWQEKTGQVDFWQFDELVTGLALYPNGNLLVAQTSDIIQFDPETEAAVPVFSMTAAQPKHRFNDGACDPLGRFWVGSMQNNIADDSGETEDLASTGGIYRVGVDRDAHFFDEKLACPNAICWSPDAAILYVADSMAGWLYSYAFDLDRGLLGNREEFCRFDGFGIPDGAAVDRDGCIWNARWGAGAVLRITPDAKIDQIVRVPTTNATACAFGGEDLRTLYITTARCGLTGSQLKDERLAGGVFSVYVEVPGLRGATFGAA